MRKLPYLLLIPLLSAETCGPPAPVAHAKSPNTPQGQISLGVDIVIQPPKERFIILTPAHPDVSSSRSFTLDARLADVTCDGSDDPKQAFTCAWTETCTQHCTVSMYSNYDQQMIDIYLYSSEAQEVDYANAHHTISMTLDGAWQVQP